MAFQTSTDSHSAHGTTQPRALSPLEPVHGRMGYVLLWFPLSSETFIFREVSQLRQMGMAIDTYTLYGSRTKGLSQEMLDYDGKVTHIGMASSLRIVAAFLKALRRRPRLVFRLIRDALLRRMRTLETYAENTLSFFAGFLLAEKAVADGISLLHAPWANGPATAAWVASRLTGIPFAFTGRAGDIYPQDGLLPEKIREAAFVRTNNAANIDWLRQFCPQPQWDRLHLVYNSLTFIRRTDCPCPCTPPYKVLAIGRFARKKGFPFLLTAMARLSREGFPVHLTLVGDGSWRRRLEGQIRRLGLGETVTLTGFVPNDRVAAIMQEHDVFVMPSIVHSSGDRDGIPNVIMEALSTGMPVIATDVCGIREVIHNGKTGVLIPQRNARAISEAIRWTVTHRHEALAMAHEGRKLVLEMFDAERNIRSLFDLYSAAIPACTGGEQGSGRDKETS